MADKYLSSKLIVQRVGNHLSELSQLVSQIEFEISKKSNGDSDAKEYVLENLQGLDFLRQSLDDVAHLSQIIANHVSDPLPEKVLLAHVSLDSTRALIKGTGVTNSKLDGELDLF